MAARKSGVEFQAGVVMDVKDAPLRYPFLERFVITGHWVWYIALVIASGMPLGLAATWVVVSQGSCGLFLALAFGVGHNGMMIWDADKKPGYAELQVTTTRNVVDGPFVGWFMGGLQWQIEHHIFPTVPRHNLHKVGALFAPICRKHGIPYRATSMWEGTVQVLTHLGEVSREMRNGPM